jgi:hypothetical protein
VIVSKRNLAGPHDEVMVPYLGFSTIALTQASSASVALRLGLRR